MKKEQKPPKQGKEFASQPFKGLKGFHAEVREPQPAASPKSAPQPAEVSDDEMDMFLREMAGVRRLQKGAPARAKGVEEPAVPTATLRRIEEQEQQVFIEALQKLELDVVFRDEYPAGEEPPRPLPVNRMRQLKSGAIRIMFELDLHGLTRDEALESLAYFITGAYNRGQKAVLVITGKGNNSPGEPVLVGAVAGWLRERGKGMVAEFAPAPRQMGGSGAFVVFLKDKDKAGARG